MTLCPHCMKPTAGNVCQHCGRPVDWQPSPDQLPAGTLLDSGGLRRYRTGEALGQGGFGITYIAADEADGRVVAVKECFPTQCAYRAADHVTVLPLEGGEEVLQSALSSFLEEGKLLAQQSGLTSVVHVLDFFLANGTAYLVMEYLSGISLYEKVRREGRFPAQTLLAAMEPLLADLGKLHASNVIHRDISPDNLLWMPDGTLKLIDFGCAHSMEDGKSVALQLKHGFAPVEQYQTRGQGPWTDLYALCATFYYCVTGIVPPSAAERLERDSLQPPVSLGVDLTMRQQAALLWGLEVQPARRPQTAALLAAQLFADRPTPKKKTSPRLIAAVASGAAVLVVLLGVAIAAAAGAFSSSPAVEPITPASQSRVPLAASSPASEASSAVEPETQAGVTAEGLAYEIEDGEARITGFDGDASGIVVFPDEIDGSPVTAIAEDAFRAQELTGALFPPELAEIGENAFRGCDALAVVYICRDADVADNAFSGCDALRVVVELEGFSYEEDGAGWGLPEETAAYPYGEETGSGDLRAVSVEEDGAVYALTEDDTAVLLSVPVGAEEYAVPEEVEDCPVSWCSVHAFDAAEEMVSVYLAEQMAFPFELFSEVDWLIKDEHPLESFSMSWFLTCLIASYANDDRLAEDEEAPLAVPERGYVLAAMTRAEELAEIDQHPRPDGSAWGEALEEQGVTYTYASQFKDHISLDDEESLLEDMLRKCAGDMAPKSESYGVYYVSCGAALYQDENTVYLDRLAGTEEE